MAVRLNEPTEAGMNRDPERGSDLDDRGDANRVVGGDVAVAVSLEEQLRGPLVGFPLEQGARGERQGGVVVGVRERTLPRVEVVADLVAALEAAL